MRLNKHMHVRIDVTMTAKRIIFALFVTFVRVSRTNIVKLGPTISGSNSPYDVTSARKVFLLPDYVPYNGAELFAFSVLLSSLDAFSLLVLRPQSLSVSEVGSPAAICSKEVYDQVGQYQFFPMSSAGNLENVYLESFQLNQGCTKLNKGDRFGLFFSNDRTSIATYLTPSSSNLTNSWCGSFIDLSKDSYDFSGRISSTIAFDKLPIPYTLQINLYLNYADDSSAGAGSSSPGSVGKCTNGLLIPRSLASNVTAKPTVPPFYKGVQGSKGQAGVKGATGFQGIPGQQGSQGQPGKIGPTGSTGETGQTGPMGNTGWIGNTGATGFMGATGSLGPTGLQGPIGVLGDTGEPGFRGKNYTKDLGKKHTNENKNNDTGQVSMLISESFFDKDIAIIALFIWLPIISFLCLLTLIIIIVLCVKIAKF
ncbi:hypothetical protein HELRODRAFT_191878 [Helobdella robusta]|uniref:Uncharacterized protein n=1 Tax=Helobdella robusta TaxID=6412 RepID=T1FTD7_HELRO|nr:hypothetical protein HELRODRAFT_191878 [Helobdella robusta]ESO03573.1 hypothetical protein HELRODRAFT_191878 [Helobdella robusta]